MEQIKFFSCRNSSSRGAICSVEKEVNKFLLNELPKLGGKLVDIKLSTTAKDKNYLVSVIVIYKKEDTT